MLVKVFILVVVLTALVVQSNNAETIQGNERFSLSDRMNSPRDAHSTKETTTPVMKSIIGDLKKQIEELIKSFEGMVNDVIPGTRQTCQHLMETITNLSKICMGEGNKNISNGINKILVYIKECTADAAQAKVDITMCIVGKKTELADLSINLANNLAECVSNVANSSVKRVEHIISVCDTIVQDLTKMPIEMIQCGWSWHPIDCLKSLVAQIANQIIKTPMSLIDLLNEAKILVASLPDNLLGCSVRASNETRIKTGVIHDQIKTCVDDKMKDAPSPIAALMRNGRAPMDELHKQIKESISTLNHLISSVVNEAIGTECISTIITANDQSVQEHVDDIVQHVASSIDWIQNITAEAAKLGFNVDVCVKGKEEQFNKLEYFWIEQMTRRINDTVNQAIDNVETELINSVNRIISTVLNMPIKLGKCAIDGKQWKCLTDLLQSCNEMNSNLPARISVVVDAALTIAHNIPSTINTDTASIKDSITAQTNDIKKDITSCCDNILQKASYYAQPIF